MSKERDAAWRLYAKCVDLVYEQLRWLDKQRPAESLQERLSVVLGSTYARALKNEAPALHDKKRLADFAGEMAVVMAKNGMMSFTVDADPSTQRLRFTALDTEAVERNCMKRCRTLCALLIARQWPQRPPRAIRTLVARMVWATCRDPDLWGSPEARSYCASGIGETSMKRRRSKESWL